MPIIFISLNETFTEKIKQYGFKAKTMKIQDYVPNPNKKLIMYLLLIVYALWTEVLIIFPNIEIEVKNIVKQLGITSIIGKPYLPIGSSIIIDKGNKSLVISPTMLLPQNVSNTKNAYYATMSVLYNILINILFYLFLL